ncbi:class I SAM-dependent methyltransferase [Pedobacter caeni]|uniref:Phospholipid N-methyltransferase n=1 Tax=Pedobacter caeni TaxID=288992 RepID=A0A1M5AFM0_9SPHI|nr:methyltransferase domain-containing protein [Pedobacter caeni]SHF28914.1 Phospholipid N-methyltransferase [Pedobacter caeni]
MFVFVREAYRNIVQTGSIIESSPFLAKKMMQFIDFENSLQIVELGAGKGSITGHLLDKMSPQSKLSGFEMNNILFDELKKEEDHRFVPIHDDVMNITRYFREGSVDYIISGLPLANMGGLKKGRLMNDCYQLLKPGGCYIQFQYCKTDLALIKRNFENVHCEFTLLNLPPAFVYYAEK